MNTANDSRVDRSNDSLVVLGGVTAVVFPIVGIACAIALMARRGRRGGTILVLSITMIFAWPVILFLLFA